MDILLGARFLFAVVGLLICFTVYKIVVLETNSKEIGLIAICFLMANSYFFLRGFRIRSDLLATGLNLLFLYLYLNLHLNSGNSKKISTLRESVMVALALLVILTTPKAIYHYVINFIFILIFEISGQAINGSFQRAMRSAVLFQLLPLGLLALVIWVLKYYFAFDFMYDAYAQALSYYFSSFNYFYIEHLNRFMQIFIASTFFIGIMIFFLIKKNMLKTQDVKTLSPYIIFIISSVLILILHNQKYPFFIASYMPYIYISACIIFYRFLVKTKILSLALCVLTLGISTHILYNNLNKTHLFSQLDFIKKFEIFLRNNPHVTYYDGAGLFPIDNMYPYYFGPEELNHIQWFNIMKSLKPDVILLTPRMKSLEPNLSHWLKKNYNEHENGVWFKCIDFKNYKMSYIEDFNNYTVGVKIEDLERIISSEIGFNTNQVLLRWDELGSRSSSFGKFVKIKETKGKQFFSLWEISTIYKDLEYDFVIDFPANTCISRYYEGEFASIHLAYLFSYDQ